MQKKAVEQMQKGACPLELPARLVANHHAMSKRCVSWGLQKAECGDAVNR